MDDSRFQHAMQLRDRGEELSAIAVLRQLLAESQSAEDRIAILLNLVTCHARLGDQAQSRALAEQACVAARAEGGPELRLCADYLYAIGELDEAKQLELLTRLQSEFSDLLTRPEQTELATEIQQRIGSALTNLGRFNEAIPILENALALPESDYQRLHLFLALCRIQSNDVEQGIEDYKLAADGPDAAVAAESNYALGVLAWNGGDYKLAREHFEKVVTNPGNNPNAPELAGRSAELVQRIDEYLSRDSI